MDMTLGAYWYIRFENVTAGGTMHVKRKERIFQDEKVWGGISYYTVTYYKIIERWNRMEVLCNREILTLTLLTPACTAHI